MSIKSKNWGRIIQSVSHLQNKFGFKNQVQTLRLRVLNFMRVPLVLQLILEDKMYSTAYI